MSKNGGGDQLARGAIRVQFTPAETTQELWDKAFNDFDPEKAKKEEKPKMKGTKEITTR